MNATGRIDISAEGLVTGDVFVYPENFVGEVTIEPFDTGWGCSGREGAEFERLSGLTHSDRPTVTTGVFEEEIEITDEMIEAGAEVLLGDSFLNLSASIAEGIAEKVLRRGLSASRNRSDKGWC